MNNLTGMQIIKLIEENLNNKFRYHLDDMKFEKRPFGNSGYPQIAKDMIDITGNKKTFTVSSEEEFEELNHQYMQDCFDDIKEWISKNNEDFKVKIIKKELKNDIDEQEKI